MDILKVILCSLFSVISLFVITKFMGHKQVAQLDFFDYICGITIGSIAAELATELESPFVPFVALITYGLVSLFLNALTRKFPRSRKYVNGSPTILVNDGKIYKENLKKAKLDLSEFLLLCRETGYFDLSEIQTAIFEHNGKLSILPKSEYRPATPSDLNMNPESTHIGTELIMDGRIMGDNLHRSGLDEEWLKKALASQGYKDACEILLGVYYPQRRALSLYPIK